MRLSDFKALTFDCYGTLIDWESGMVRGLEPLTRQLASPLPPDEILAAHAFHESHQQRQTPTLRYQELLPIVYRRLAEEWQIAVTWQECWDYGQSVKEWPAFPDSAEALRYLKQHYKLVILSNVDNESFSASNQKLGVSFDAVYTAEDIGSYKPADENFEFMLSMLQRLGIEKPALLHTAQSMYHDHAPANFHGIPSCWIDRRHDKEGFGVTMSPGEMPYYQFCFKSMAAMVEAHQAELASEPAE